jgi:hypothetical protein
MPDTILIDPLGRKIVMHDHTGYGHIVKGHPDVRAGRAFAENAISNPLEIRRSKSDADCRPYYGISATAGTMIVVVADVALGVVKTAYRAKVMKGLVEWSP